MSRARLVAFVSSRMQELAAERRIVKAELDELYVDAWVFEKDAGARSQSIQQTYLKEVEAADLYIGIFWRGYGAYTLEEYDHARSLGKPRLIYEKRSELESRDPRLARFLAEIGAVESGLTVRWFETPEELGGFVKQDVAAWQAELVRQARHRGHGVPLQAPPLGDQYVERTAMMKRLQETLSALDEQGTPRVTRAVLHGIGGLGKTVTASAFARLEPIRQRFPDGVLWVTVGQNPDLTQRLSDWGRALHDPSVGATGYPDPIAGMNQLRTLLAERACLLVVDDVWQPDHARAFIVGGPRCLLLVTTRIAEIAAMIGALAIELDEMTPAEALSLVERWSGPVVDEERETADWLMRRVGYLPLALELIGAQVRKVGGWEAYRRRWDSQRLKAVRRGRRSHGRHDNLWDSLDLSVAALSAEDRGKYFSLGVFPEDAAFTSGACAALWGYPEDEAAEVLIDFAEQALLREVPTPQRRTYVLHDLFSEYILEHLRPEQRVQTHRALVAGYRTLCPGGWHEGPDDGYFFEHLAHHLAEVGLASELYELIDRRWMESQLRRAHSHRAFASDLGKVLAVAASETPPNLFQLVRATYIRATLQSLASRYVPEALAALARIGRVEVAYGHAELIQEPARRSRAYRLTAEALLARGEIPQARRALQDALVAARNVGRYQERFGVLSELVDTCMDAGEPTLARRVAGDAEAIARTKDFPSDLLLQSAWAHERVGNTYPSERAAEDALAIAERRNDPVEKLAHLVRLQTVFTKTGNLDRAREIAAKETAVFDEVDNAFPADGRVYPGFGADLCEAFVKVGRVDAAVAVTERWARRDWKGAGMLARVASALLTLDRREQASRIAEKCTEIVRDLLEREAHGVGIGERTENLGYVSEALVRAGRGEEAVELAAAAPYVGEKSHAFGVIALAFAEADQDEDARHAAEASLAASHRVEENRTAKALWFAAAARALHGVGRKSQASETASRVLRLAEDWKDYGPLAVRNLSALAGMLADLGEWRTPSHSLSALWTLEKRPRGSSD